MRKQNILRSIVTYIFRQKQKSIPFPKLKTWEKWIFIVWEKYGKTQTFQIYGLLKYFGWSRNPCNSQNMWKVGFYSKGKVWENTNIPNLWVSQIFWVTQKSIQFPKNGKNGFPLYGKSTGKHKKFQVYGFLKYFRWSRNPCNSQNMSKVDFHSTGKVWKNTNVSNL